MATLRGALSQSELEVLSLSKEARYPHGARVKPGYELGVIARDFLDAGDVQSLRPLLGLDELSRPYQRADRSMRLSESTLALLDEIANQIGGATRISVVRALLIWRKRALEEEAANSEAQEGRSPVEFTTFIRLCSGEMKHVEVEATAASAMESAAAAYALLTEQVLNNSDSKVNRSIRVKQNEETECEG